MLNREQATRNLIQSIQNCFTLAGTMNTGAAVMGQMSASGAGNLEAPTAVGNPGSILGWRGRRVDDDGNRIDPRHEVAADEAVEPEPGAVAEDPSRYAMVNLGVTADPTADRAEALSYMRRANEQASPFLGYPVVRGAIVTMLISFEQWEQTLTTEASAGIHVIPPVENGNRG